MDAVGKLDLLQIEFETFEFVALAVAVEVGVDVLDEVADSEVVFAVLIPENVAAGDGCLCQIVDEDALLRGQILKIGHFVAKHLDVGETVDCVVEIVSRFLCGF